MSRCPLETHVEDADFLDSALFDPLCQSTPDMGGQKDAKEGGSAAEFRVRRGFRVFRVKGLGPEQYSLNPKPKALSPKL